MALVGPYSIKSLRAEPIGFHGSAYEYWQNTILNAAPHFGIPDSTGTGFTPQQAPFFRYDEYGGSIGGPILKNKLFFFFVYDKIYNNGSTSATNGITPTLAERGMGTAFPGAYDFSASGLPTLYDPATTTSNAALAVVRSDPRPWWSKSGDVVSRVLRAGEHGSAGRRQRHSRRPHRSRSSQNSELLSATKCRRPRRLYK